MNEQKYYVKVNQYGTFWYSDSEMTILHRKNSPATEHVDGSKFWYLHGLRHREDGPAVEWASGDKFWYLHGKLHRENGPACEYANGTKAWYLHDERYREDGPAVELANGSKAWYLNSKFLTKEEWEKQVSTATPSCEGKVIEIEGKKYKLTLV